MRLLAPFEVVALDRTSKTLAFAAPDHVHILTPLETVNGQLVAHSGYFLGAEFTQEPQRRQIVSLQVTQLTGSQFLGMDFPKPNLDGRVPIAFGKTNLGN